jgi:hypothetical protein
MVHEWTPQEGLITALIAGAPDESDSRQFSCATARKVSDYSVWRFIEAPEGLPQRNGGRASVAHWA